MTDISSRCSIGAALDRAIPKGIRATSGENLELAICADHAKELLGFGLLVFYNRPHCAAKRALPLPDVGDFRNRIAARHITAAGPMSTGTPHRTINVVNLDYAVSTVSTASGATKTFPQLNGRSFRSDALNYDDADLFRPAWLQKDIMF